MSVQHSCNSFTEFILLFYASAFVANVVQFIKPGIVSPLTNWKFYKNLFGWQLLPNLYFEKIPHLNQHLLTFRPTPVMLWSKKWAAIYFKDISDMLMSAEQAYLQDIFGPSGVFAKRGLCDHDSSVPCQLVFHVFPIIRDPVVFHQE